MFCVEPIGRVQGCYRIEKHSTSQIAPRPCTSRNTVTNYLKSNIVPRKYTPRPKPFPEMGPAGGTISGIAAWECR